MKRATVNNLYQIDWLHNKTTHDRKFLKVTINNNKKNKFKIVFANVFQFLQT